MIGRLDFMRDSEVLAESGITLLGRYHGEPAAVAASIRRSAGRWNREVGPQDSQVDWCAYDHLIHQRRRVRR